MQQVSKTSLQRIKALQKAGEHYNSGNKPMAEIWTRRAHKLAERQGYQSSYRKAGA